MRKRSTRFSPQAEDAARATEQLRSHFGLTLHKSEEDAWGLILLYQNSTTGLQFQYSPGEQEGWRVVVGRLVAGSFPKHPIHVDQNTDLQRFDLRDLAAERVQILPDYQAKMMSGASLTISELSDIASRSAKDVLLGNFSVFPALRLRVLARVSNN